MRTKKIENEREAEINIAPGVNYLISVLSKNIGSTKWVDKTPEELAASKAQGIDYPFKTVHSPILEGSVIVIDGKSIDCGTVDMRNYVIGMAKECVTLQEKVDKLRTERANSVRHPLAGGDGDQPLKTELQITLTEEQAKRLEAFRKRAKIENTEQAIPYLVDMVFDRLDRGYWRYLAISSLVAKFNEDVQYYSDSNDLAPKWAMSMLKTITQLKAGDSATSDKLWFGKWANAWDNETGGLSVGHNKHWAYYAIMSLGDQIVPWVLERIEDGGHIKWHNVLISNTGVDPTKPKDRREIGDSKMIAYSVSNIMEAWVKWGRKNGLLREAVDAARSRLAKNKQARAKKKTQ